MTADIEVFDRRDPRADEILECRFGVVRTGCMDNQFLAGRVIGVEQSLPAGEQQRGTPRGNGREE